MVAGQAKTSWIYFRNKAYR